MKFFHPSVRLTNQKPCAFVSVRLTKQIALLPFGCCFCFVRVFHFIRKSLYSLFRLFVCFSGPQNRRCRIWGWLPCHGVTQRCFLCSQGHGLAGLCYVHCRTFWIDLVRFTPSKRGWWEINLNWSVLFSRVRRDRGWQIFGRRREPRIKSLWHPRKVRVILNLKVACSKSVEIAKTDHARFFSRLTLFWQRPHYLVRAWHRLPQRRSILLACRAFQSPRLLLQ